MTRLVRTLAALCAIALLIAVPQQARADTLIDNVNGITIDKSGEVTRFTALVFDDRGIITQVLERGDPRPQTEFAIDGAGRFMLPGMIDAHVNTMELGFAQFTLDLSDATSLEEALDKIEDFARDNDARPWILGRGWDEQKWGLGRYPTAAELDAVTDGRPVWLERAGGHAGWASSRAMQIAGITSDTADIEDGDIIRDPAGVPTGVFIDKSRTLIERVLPAPRPGDRDAAFVAAQDKLLSQGITAIADMGTSMADWQTFRRAGDGGRLKIRIVSYAGDTETMELIAGPGPTLWLYDDRLRLNGVELVSDGALGSRGALLLEPYADRPETRGHALLGPTELRNAMSRAALDKFQVAIHAIGDAANRDALLAIEELSEVYGGDRRWRIEHAQIVAPDDLPRFGANGTIASMQPLHQTADRTMAEARLGARAESRLGEATNTSPGGQADGRLKGAYAWRSILAAGGRLAFGSAAPVAPADPFAGIAAAISRTDANAEPFGGWRAQETISREAALRAFTTDAAYAAFADGRYGRLVPGERADFLLVDRDILLSSPADIRQTRIDEVWIGGEMVLKN